MSQLSCTKKEYGVGIRKKIRSHIQKIDIFSRKKLSAEMIPKSFPHHIHHFSCRNSTNYTPILSPFRGLRDWNLAFFCYTRLRKQRFSRKKRSQKASPKMQRFPTSSKCRKALFLIIFYGGSHMFHSDPRMRFFCGKLIILNPELH